MHHRIVLLLAVVTLVVAGVLANFAGATNDISNAQLSHSVHLPLVSSQSVAPPTAGQRWSDPATWGGNVPQAGAAVTIPAGKTVILDISPPALKSLQIDGSLIFADVDLRLSAEWIMVHGRLQVGSAQTPFRSRATIMLTGNDQSQSIMGMGGKVLGVMNGTLDLYGTPRIATWTRLAATAAVGSSSLTLEQAVDWKPGDEIVIASTDHVQSSGPRSEQRVIKAVNGKTIELDVPLAYGHWSADEFGVPQRAEVGLLTRNIVVRGDDSSATSRFGAHLMVMGNAAAHIDWVDFRLMGQFGKMGRYPIHFHQMGDKGVNSFVKHSTIRQAFNRCITIHGTNNLLVEGNVTYDTLGHCFYFEEGSEIGNTLKNNLALVVKAMKPELVPHDERPSAYWLNNPDNTVVGNVSVEAHGGFMIAPSNRPIPFGRTGQDLSWMDAIKPKRTPMREFRGNVAHSGVWGITTDRGMASTGCAHEAPRNECPKDHVAALLDFHHGTDWVPTQVAELHDMVLYKHREYGANFRGGSQRLINPRIADNTLGITTAGGPEGRGNGVVGGVIVGETSNNGTKVNTYTGARHYDGRALYRDIRFRNFSGGTNAALGFTTFNLSPDVYTEQLTFDAGVRRMYIDEVSLQSRNGLEDTIARIFDKDGSLTGKPEHWVVDDNPILHNSACEPKPDWKAYVCPHTYIGMAVWFDKPYPAAPIRINRDDGVSMQMGIGRETIGDHFDMQLLANKAGTAPLHTYTVNYGGTSKPAKLTLGAWNLPFADNGFLPPGAEGSSVVIGVPFPEGSLYASRHNRSMTAVNSLAELKASPLGDVYYREGSLVYVKVVLDRVKGGTWFDGTFIKLCSTQDCK